MRDLLQFVLIGLGLGSSYALFAQGTVLIYRGSGIVNFGQGALGALAAYVTFATMVQDHGQPVAIAVPVGIGTSVVASLLFEAVVLRRLQHAAPIVRLISTLGLLGLVQAALEHEYGQLTRPVKAWLPSETFDWGGVRVQEQVIYIVGTTFLLTVALWAFTSRSRIGMAMTAAAENERAVRALGWSPAFVARFTWGLGAALAGVAGVMVAPLSGLSTVSFTVIVTVSSLAAALLGGFRSFPLTLVGGLVIGIGEAMVTRYNSDLQSAMGIGQITGLNRAVPFLAILLVLVVHGQALPLRSHITDRLPRLGTGQLRPLATAGALALALVAIVGLFDDRWAAAACVSLGSAVVVLSVIVLTGFAGQVSLGQMAVAGVGALFAGLLIDRAGWPMGLAIPVGIVAAVPAGLLFALPALRTRGVNLAVVTLGLGFTVSEVVFANSRWIGRGFSGGTEVGPAAFGVEVDATTHPHRWALVCLIALVTASIGVANLRRSATGRRLVAVRTNERAAASLGISVVGVKLYAFGVASLLAAAGGVLIGFRSSIVTYEQFNVFSSIDAVTFAVIGGVGFAVGAVVSAPNAIGGLGTRVLEDLLHVGDWDHLVGGVALLAILVAHQDGLADLGERFRRPGRRRTEPGADGVDVEEAAPSPRLEPAAAPGVEAKPLTVRGLTVRFGGVVAADDVTLEVLPGEVVGLIGPNGAGKTTVIDAITGFVTPSAGTIELGAQPIERWSASRRALAGLRRSFQSLELFEDSTVVDNIRAGADTASRRSWLLDLVWPRERPLPDTALAAIREFELEPDLDRLPKELSFGRRRLTGIARAVASGPSIILLDEPAAGLDEVESRELATLIRALAIHRGMGVLLVEHDVGLVMSICDRVVVLEFGRVIASGTPDEVRRDPAVLSAYLGTPPAATDDPVVGAVP